MPAGRLAAGLGLACMRWVWRRRRRRRRRPSREAGGRARRCVLALAGRQTRTPQHKSKTRVATYLHAGGRSIVMHDWYGSRQVVMKQVLTNMKIRSDRTRIDLKAALLVGWLQYSFLFCCFQFLLFFHFLKINF
jgi:hypothetical protein